MCLDILGVVASVLPPFQAGEACAKERSLNHKNDFLTLLVFCWNLAAMKQEAHMERSCVLCIAAHPAESPDDVPAGRQHQLVGSMHPISLKTLTKEEPSMVQKDQTKLSQLKTARITDCPHYTIRFWLSKHSVVYHRAQKYTQQDSSQASPVPNCGGYFSGGYDQILSKHNLKKEFQA